MRTMLVTIILGTLLLGSVTLAQEQRAKTTITGWPPYTFGADLATVLQANSNLKRGCVMNGRRTEEPAGWLCVQGNVDAPVVARVGHSEEPLHPFYDHLRRKHNELQTRLSRGEA